MNKKHLFVFVLLFFLLALRYFQEFRLNQNFTDNQKLKLKFCLFKEPYLYSTGQYHYYQNHFQTIKIKLANDKKYQLGDCLEIVGKIRPCEKQSRAPWCLLNASKKAYLRDPGLKLYFSKLVKKFERIRQRLAAPILQTLPYPQSDLLTGIVLGRQSKMDNNFFSQLQRSGTLHIIVASGYNLTVVGEKPAYFLSFIFGFSVSIVLGILFVWFYVGITGFQLPVVRAGVMITFLLLAKLIGRKASQIRVVILSVWLMLMLKPDLVVNISFQLTVGALLGLMLAPKIFKDWQKKNWLTGIIAETVSTQIIVAPIIIYHFQRVSLLAPISNVFIVPLVPILLLGGVLGVVLSWLPYLSKIVFWLLLPFLTWMIWVIKLFSMLPFAEIGF